MGYDMQHPYVQRGYRDAPFDPLEAMQTIAEALSTLGQYNDPYQHDPDRREQGDLVLVHAQAAHEDLERYIQNAKERLTFDLSGALVKYRQFIENASHFQELLELGPAMQKGYDGEIDEDRRDLNCRLAALWRSAILERGFTERLVPWPDYLPDYGEALKQGQARKAAHDERRADG